MHQRNTLEFRKDVAQLRRVGFQEFASGRNIEEQVLNGKLLPLGQETASWLSTLEPAINSRVPSSSPAGRVFNSTSATAAMEANASPRKPMVRRANKSAASRIFEVA